MVGVKCVKFCYGVDLVLPWEVFALDIFIEFEDLFFELGEVLAKADLDLSPAERAASSEAALACEKVIILVNDDGVDKADAGDGVGEVFDAGEGTALAAFAIYDDGVDVADHPITSSKVSREMGRKPNSSNPLCICLRHSCSIAVWSKSLASLRSDE
jgi:hypothetical protein